MDDAASPPPPALHDAVVQLVSPPSLLCGSLDTVQIDLAIPTTNEHLDSQPCWLLQPLSPQLVGRAGAAAQQQLEVVQLGRPAAGVHGVALSTCIRPDAPGVLSLAVYCQPTSSSSCTRPQHVAACVPLLVAPSTAVQSEMGSVFGAMQEVVQHELQLCGKGAHAGGGLQAAAARATWSTHYQVAPWLASGSQAL